MGTDGIAIIAFIIFRNWYDSLFGVKAFQANPLPHLVGLVVNMILEMLEIHNAGRIYHLDLNERHFIHGLPQCFVMTYDEAIKLLQETYSGSMQDLGYKISSIKYLPYNVAKTLYGIMTAI